MKTLKTERLILRKFAVNDFGAVHNYASSLENVIYMPFGPNSENDTRTFIDMAIAEADKSSCKNYQYAVTLKGSGVVIGGCGIGYNPMLPENTAVLGWLLHRDYWRQGYGAEIGEVLLAFGFEEMNLHRIVAYCDAENMGSYKLMEKIGMRREGLFLESQPAHKMSERKYSNELAYAVLKSEWEARREVEYYSSAPCIFDGFIELPELSDGIIHLVCTEKMPYNPETKWVPSYSFMVCKGGEKIGNINLRIGYSESLYYGGQIGYGIDEKYRGSGYAVRACRLLLPVIKAHGMKKILITNDYTNTASQRVCEKLGAQLRRVARIPKWHDMYKRGMRFANIYEWDVGQAGDIR